MTKTKTIDNCVEVTLTVNEPMRSPWGIGDAELIYAGMPSRDSFALIETDCNGSNPRTLFFPAKPGVIDIWSSYGGGTRKGLSVKEVAPNYVTLAKNL